MLHRSALMAGGYKSMMRSVSICRENSCPQKAEVGSHYCAKHQKADTRVQRVRDDVDRRYSRAPWPGFRLTMLCQNRICQRLDRRGEQCNSPARLVHHLQSPRVRPDLFVEPTNVVSLCEHCHPPDEGTPWWKKGVDYVKGSFRLPHFSHRYDG